MTNLLRTAILATSLLLSFSTIAAPNTNDNLAQAIQKSLESNKVTPDTLSLAIVPLTGNGKAIYINADTPMNPASTMKLLTTYSALELLGPGFRWKTAFYTDGEVKNGIVHGNLYLKGNGDPKLNMERLWLLLRDLRNNGITAIKGNLILDRSYFNIPEEKVFLDDSNESYRPYLVSPDSLLINFKVIRIISHTDNKQAKIVSDPPLKDLQIINELQVIAPKKKNHCPVMPDIEYIPVTQQNGTVKLTVSGNIVEECNVQKYISLFDHDRYAVNIIRSFWKELGGQISGQSKIGIMPKDAKLLAVTWSPDLVEVIRDINKFSNNTMAKQLFLTIGARNRKADDKNDAEAAYRTIYNWLLTKGVSPEQLKMENGSGLSREERITAKEMVGLLQMAWKGNYSAEFIASMPIIGVDGTMSKRLRKTDARGRGHIKTGTLNNVRAIAGYIRDKHNDVWAIAAILNDSKPWGSSDILDDILLDTYNQ